MLRNINKKIFFWLHKRKLWHWYSKEKLDTLKVDINSKYGLTLSQKKKSFFVYKNSSLFKKLSFLICQSGFLIKRVFHRALIFRSNLKYILWALIFICWLLTLLIVFLWKIWRLVEQWMSCYKNNDDIRLNELI